MKFFRLTYTFPVLILLLLTILFSTVYADPRARNQHIYMPVTVGGSSTGCDLPQDNFASLSVTASPQTGDLQTDEDVNLAYRGWAPTTAAHQLVDLGPVWDKKAPQFPSMFADRRTARISSVYQRYRWDPTCDCPKDTYSPWDVTVLGLAVKPGETIYTPDSKYDIGGGYEYQVMFASNTGITLYIGRDDDFNGYVVHIEDICVDRDLLHKYQKLDDAGRRSLPALRGHQAFARALGAEIKVAVRDTGHFLDPRSRNDWWQGR
jgi:hypothetical protein